MSVFISKENIPSPNPKSNKRISEDFLESPKRKRHGGVSHGLRVSALHNTVNTPSEMNLKKGYSINSPEPMTMSTPAKYDHKKRNEFPEQDSIIESSVIIDADSSRDIKEYKNVDVPITYDPVSIDELRAQAAQCDQSIAMLKMQMASEIELVESLALRRSKKSASNSTTSPSSPSSSSSSSSQSSSSPSRSNGNNKDDSADEVGHIRLRFTRLIDGKLREKSAFLDRADTLSACKVIPYDTHVAMIDSAVAKMSSRVRDLTEEIARLRNEQYEEMAVVRKRAAMTEENAKKQAELARREVVQLLKEKESGLRDAGDAAKGKDAAMPSCGVGMSIPNISSFFGM